MSFLLSGCSVSNNIQDATLDKNLSSSSEEVCSDMDKLIYEKEKEYEIPKGTLRAMAVVESKVHPYAVNSQRKAHYFPSKQAAINFVNTSIAKGHRNMSVGCLQLHYNSHRNKFGSVCKMLDPSANVDYAAKLLKTLYNQYGSWETAIKKYHAGKSSSNAIYYQKVMRNLKS